MINVCRPNVLDGAVRAFARRGFTPEAKLSVVFMDDYNQAEGAVDEGGPKRVFFLMLALKESAKIICRWIAMVGIPHIFSLFNLLF